MLDVLEEEDAKVISAGDHFVGNENGQIANELEYFRQC